MVGTVHRDPRGKAKLLKLLQQERPAIICVEISPYARRFRAQKAAAFRATLRENLSRIKREEGKTWHQIFSHGGIQGIFLLLKEPYEWQAARAFARQTGSILKGIDLSRYSEEKLSYLAELVSLDNLRALLRIPFPDLTEQVETHYARARSLFSHPPSIWPTSHEGRERETYMANKIRTLVRQAKGQKVIHVGGWEHLVESPSGHTLFDRLKDIAPRRVLLSELREEAERNHLGEENGLIKEKAVGTLSTK